MGQANGLARSCWQQDSAGFSAASPTQMSRCSTASAASSSWIVEVLLVYTLLSYPTGRLNRRPERWVVGFAAALALVLYVLTTPLVHTFPNPSPLVQCGSHCPPSSFFVVGSEPGVIGSVIVPLRELLTIGLYFAVALLLALRLSAATSNLRRTLTPVLGAAVLRCTAVLRRLPPRRSQRRCPRCGRIYLPADGSCHGAGLPGGVAAVAHFLCGRAGADRLRATRSREPTPACGTLLGKCSGRPFAAGLLSAP